MIIYFSIDFDVCARNPISPAGSAHHSGILRNFFLRYNLFWLFGQVQQTKECLYVLFIVRFSDTQWKGTKIESILVCGPFLSSFFFYSVLIVHSLKRYKSWKTTPTLWRPDTHTHTHSHEIATKFVFNIFENKAREMCTETISFPMWSSLHRRVKRYGCC